MDSISSEIDEVTRAITKAKVTIKTAERLACLYVYSITEYSSLYKHTHTVTCYCLHQFRNLKKCQGKVASLEKNIASATEKISNLEVRYGSCVDKSVLY